MKLPNLDDLISEQLVVYEHDPAENLFVAGPPGSGKTSLAILRAKFVLNLERSVVLVTRNRMLAVLAAQLGDGAIAAKTMNAFVAKTYYDRFGRNAPEPTAFQYDWDAIFAEYLAADAEPAIDHLVVDEGQNLPSGFFRWAARFASKTITVFADEDQTTDPLRSSLADICNAGLPAPVRLQANHRNTAEIAAVAEHFHRSQILPPALVRRPRGGELPRLVSITTWVEFSRQVGARYRNRHESIGIVVRQQTEVKILRDLLRQALPAATRVDGYTSDGAALASAIRLLEPGVTVVTSESVIGLEFDTVYLQDLSRSLPCTSTDAFRRMYMLCARARDTLVLLNGPVPLAPKQIESLPAADVLER